MLTFGAPLSLLSLLVVPLSLAAYLALQRRSVRHAVSFTNLGVLESVVGRGPVWRRRLSLGLLLAALATLCVAVARPTVTTVAVQKRATVVLVVDTSRSMRATDVAPTRLGAAKLAIRRFLARVPHSVRIALVAFSDEPQVLVLPTTDRGLVGRGVDRLTLGSGTAIGDSIAHAVRLFRAPGGGPARALSGLGRATAIVLVSDGAQTSGRLGPLAGARRAQTQNIPVYTIALGSATGMIEVRSIDERKLFPAPPDRVTLERIAAATGGAYFAAPNARRLESVYAHLGSRIARIDRARELTDVVLLTGIVLLLTAGALLRPWQPRLP